MKKVLVVTYYWPPAGGPGVQRWLKFVTYLRDFGVEPILYIPKNPSYPITDPTLLKEVPASLQIYTHPISEPLQWTGRLLKRKVRRISSGIIAQRKSSLLERMLLWVRGNFFIPDARVLWVKPSLAFLEEVLKKEQIDTLVTTGPPHSMHLIGYGLKKKFGIKWVADFRDPWTSIGYHDRLKLGRRAQKRHKMLEKQVLSTADKILVTSKTTREEFRAITSKPIRVITNGYEAANYDAGSGSLDEKFTLSHIGSLLSGRNPEALWQALEELTEEDKAFKEAFRLQLVGVVSGEVLESIRNHNLQPFLKHVNYVPHQEAVQLQQQSQALLLVEIDSTESRGILPGKLFEYLASKRPILAIGPEQWEAGAMILETRAGAVFTYGAGPDIKKTLLRWFDDYRSGRLMSKATGITKYSRREVTRTLARELIWE